MAAYSQGDIIVGGADGIWRSEGHGVSWTQTLSGVTVKSVAVDIKTGYAYAGTFNNGVWVSANYGLSWEKTGLPDQWEGCGNYCEYSSIVTSPFGYVFAVAWNFGGIWRSSDNGNTWTKLENAPSNRTPLAVNDDFYRI